MGKHIIIPVLLMGLLFSSGCATKMVAINDITKQEAISDMGVQVAIKSANFTPLLHASTAYKPGTCMEVKKRDPFDGVDFCPGLVYAGNKDIVTTKAASMGTAEKLSREFSLPAGYIDSVKSGVGTKHIKGISYRLKNVKIETMKAPNIKLQDPCCTKKLVHRGRVDLVTIRRALKADVVYTVNIDESAGLTAAARKELMKKIQAGLKLKTSDIKGYSIHAKDLYWGVDPADDLYISGYEKAAGAWQAAEKAFRKDRITCEGQHECFFCTYKKAFRLPKIVEDDLSLELELADIVVGAIDYDGRHIINSNYAGSKGVTFYQLENPEQI